jgi:shikimate dehydrogenase
VAHSLSPAFQQAALDACRIPLRYVPRDLPPTELPAQFRALCQAGWAGNITVPHKEVVAELCAACTPAAQRVGAVNTVWMDPDGRPIGHNTDLDGVRATLDALLGDSPITQAVVLGAGGASAAVCVAVAERLSGHLSLVARTTDRGERLLDRLGLTGRVARTGTADADALVEGASLIINATPVGQGSEELPVPLERLSRATRLFDLVYRREGTPWIRTAGAAGFIAEDGLRMLVEQGAAAFQCWFDCEAPRDVMWRALGLPLPSPVAPRLLP